MPADQPLVHALEVFPSLFGLTLTLTLNLTLTLTLTLTRIEAFSSKGGSRTESWSPTEWRVAQMGKTEVSDTCTDVWCRTPRHYFIGGHCLPLQFIAIPRSPVETKKAEAIRDASPFPPPRGWKAIRGNPNPNPNPNPNWDGRPSEEKEFFICLMRSPGGWGR